MTSIVEVVWDRRPWDPLPTGQQAESDACMTLFITFSRTMQHSDYTSWKWEAMPTIRCRTFRWEPLMFFQIVHPLVEILPVRIFYFWSAHVAAAIGHCHMGTSKPKNSHSKKKVVPLHHFSKTFFPHHLQNGSAQARARVTKNTNSNPNVGIHVVCIHVVELWTAQWHDLNSFFNMKSIIRYYCSAERIFEAPCSYNDAASTYLATVTTPNRGLGPLPAG